MRHTQAYIRDNVGALDRIKDELAINVYRHPDLPLVGLKYSQIDSPKTHPIVRECRGIVFEEGSWDLVACSFPRFFNLGENLEESKNFRWDSFHCNEKVDGSLIICYHYAGKWRVNTSGSFGLGDVQFSGKSWEQLFWETCRIPKDDLYQPYTYIFELCTLHNKVVRIYPEPTVYLLSIFDGPHELPPDAVDYFAKTIAARRPESHHFHSKEEIASFLDEKESTDPSYEGVVVRDCNKMRIKIKTKTYVVMHHMFDNGNIFNPRRIVPLVLSGNGDEIKALFPETTEFVDQMTANLDDHWSSLLELWRDSQGIADQKEFALLVGKHPFSSILFQLRKKHGPWQDESALQSAWRSDPDRIVKRLYG